MDILEFVDRIFTDHQDSVLTIMAATTSLISLSLVTYVIQIMRGHITIGQKEADTESERVKGQSANEQRSDEQLQSLINLFGDMFVPFITELKTWSGKLTEATTGNTTRLVRIEEHTGLIRQIHSNLSGLPDTLMRQIEPELVQFRVEVRDLVSETEDRIIEKIEEHYRNGHPSGDPGERNTTDDRVDPTPVSASDSGSPVPGDREVSGT